MTEREIARVKRGTCRGRGVPSAQPRYVRRLKLQRRYAGRLVAEIRRTREKLDLLIELRTAEEQAIITGRVPL